MYSFMYSWSTVDLLTVVSDRITGAFSRSGGIQTVALDIYKTFIRVLHAGPLHKRKLYVIFGHLLGFILSFLCNIQLRVVLNRTSLHKYLVTAGVPQGYILGPTLFILCINDLPGDVTYNIAIYPDDTILYSECDLSWLELACELDFDLWDAAEWGRNWLIDFSAGKTQLVLFDHPYNSGAIDVKIDRSVLEEKLSFKMLGLYFWSKLD